MLEDRRLYRQELSMVMVGLGVAILGIIVAVIIVVKVRRKRRWLSSFEIQKKVEVTVKPPSLGLTNPFNRHDYPGRLHRISTSSSASTVSTDVASDRPRLLSSGSLSMETETEDEFLSHLPDWARGKIFNWSCFEDGSHLGEGRFGTVQRATLVSPFGARFDVAKKGVRASRDDFLNRQEELMNEGKIMTKIGYHEHIVNLQGITVSNKWHVFLILEYCSNGSLESVLTANKYKIQKILNDYAVAADGIVCGKQLQRAPQNNFEPQFDSTSKKVTISNINMLLAWSQQIATGMSFLGRHGVVHGDLASRNVLITSELTAKISDFGLSHWLYQDPTADLRKGAQPTRWMAPEALCDLRVTTQSDVWSFGVLLWEIFTGGDMPYEGIRNEHLVSLLKSGLRLRMPTHAPQQVNKAMGSCWNAEADTRPSFELLSNIFLSQISLGYRRRSKVSCRNDRKIYECIQEAVNGHPRELGNSVPTLAVDNQLYLVPNHD